VRECGTNVKKKTGDDVTRFLNAEPLEEARGEEGGDHADHRRYAHVEGDVDFVDSVRQQVRRHQRPRAAAGSHHDTLGTLLHCSYIATTGILGPEAYLSAVQKRRA
jgi:hypothetical protein